MSELDIYAKRIETLTKVAKLLRDQIQAQNKVIYKLQNDVEHITKILNRLTEDKSLKLPDMEIITDLPDLTKNQGDKKEGESEKEIPKKKSEKDELLQALNIVDNL